MTDPSLHDVSSVSDGDGLRPQLAELVALRRLAQRPPPPRRGRAGNAGQAPSPLRGRGMEYAESREYVAGDDARHIDWRVTARTGRAHTKLFQAERERVSLIVAESAGGIEDENEDDNGVEEAAATGDAVIDGADDSSVQYILTATENGYGKRTPLPDYPRKGRGTQGVIGIQTTERNGKLVAAVLMGSSDEVLLISDGGTLVRTRGSEISRVGRNTQGVTLIRLSKDEKLQAVERMDASIDEDEDEVAAAAPATTDGAPAAASSEDAAQE